MQGTTACRFIHPIAGVPSSSVLRGHDAVRCTMFVAGDPPRIFLDEGRVAGEGGCQHVGRTADRRSADPLCHGIARFLSGTAPMALPARLHAACWQHRHSTQG